MLLLFSIPLLFSALLIPDSDDGTCEWERPKKGWREPQQGRGIFALVAVAENKRPKLPMDLVSHGTHLGWFHRTKRMQEV